MIDKTYEEGLQDGRIAALKEVVDKHNERLNSHSGRIGRVEKLLYSGIGGLIFLQALPLLKQILTIVGE